MVNVFGGGNGIFDSGVIGIASIVTISSLLLGNKGTLISSVIVTLSLLLMGLLDILGIYNPTRPGTPTFADIGVIIFVTVANSATLYVLVGRLTDIAARSRKNEVLQIQANQELTEIKSSLELRVQERTSELVKRATQFQAVSEVAKRAIAIRNVEQLLPEIAHLISAQFNFYHVGIFLSDPEQKNMVLVASNSEGGKRMLERDHQLPIGIGSIVGYSAATRQPRIALDVGADSVFFDNPDLPETRSEMALPLLAGNELVGILDVQSTESNAFAQDDIEILETLADQTTIAIENARLFQETNQALATAKETYQRYFGQSWNQFIRQIEHHGYQFDNGEVKAFVETGNKQHAATKNTLSIPLLLRGDAIGQLDIQIKRDDRELTENEIALAKAAAERAALALENARLLKDAQRRAVREQTIGELSSKISSNTEIEAILRTAVQELGRQIRGAEVILELSPGQDNKGNKV